MILLSCLSTVRIPNIISHQSFYLFNLSKEPLHSLRRHFATYIMRFVNVPGDPVEEFSRWRWLLFCPTLLLIPDSFPPRQSPRKTCFFFFVKIGKGKESQRRWKCTYFLSYTLRYPAVYGSHFLENVSGYWVPIPLRKRILKTGHGYRINHGKPKLPCIRSHTFLA